MYEQIITIDRTVITLQWILYYWKWEGLPYPLPPKGSTYPWLIAVHAIVYSYEYGIRFFPKGVVNVHISCRLSNHPQN